MQRRRFLTLLAAVPLLRTSEGLSQAANPARRPLDQIRSDWKSFLPASASVPPPAPPLSLTNDEWRKRLAPAAYKVLREEGTERPFTSPLDKEKRRGVFACAGCGLPLFTSEMKYDSGTGWPSFFTTIPGAFGTKADRTLFQTRTEYHCIRCGGHHGHVFDDGPPPTRERWCNNGVALTFLPA